MAHVLHNNRVKFSKDISFFVWCTNMAVMTSGENHLYKLFNINVQVVEFCNIWLTIGVAE